MVEIFLQIVFTTTVNNNHYLSRLTPFEIDQWQRFADISSLKSIFLPEDNAVLRSWYIMLTNV